MRGLLGGRAPDIGPLLLGAVLATQIEGRTTSVVLTEVEAYTEDDPASHTFRGPSPRTRSMFGPPGTLYVYRSYGIHWCMNIATGPEGEGSALLLRAGVPREGIDVMRLRRGRHDSLTDGPGKLAQALGVTGAYDGVDVFGDGPVRLFLPDRPLGAAVTPRIGVSRAAERPWRWVATESVTCPDPGGSNDEPR